MKKITSVEAQRKSNKVASKAGKGKFHRKTGLSKMTRQVFGRRES